jgi:hypothetical protein
MSIPATVPPGVLRPVVTDVLERALEVRDEVPVSGGIGLISLREVDGPGAVLVAALVVRPVVVVRPAVLVGVVEPADVVLPAENVVAARGDPATVLAQPANTRLRAVAAAAPARSGHAARLIMDPSPSRSHAPAHAEPPGPDPVPRTGGSRKWYRPAPPGSGSWADHGDSPAPILAGRGLR